MQKPWNIIGATASFSSRGPRADGEIKPDILAPGTMIISSMSSTIDNNYLELFKNYFISGRKYLEMQGTSMAAPHVTGAIALLLEANPNLSVKECRDILHRTAKVDDFTGVVPNNTAGWGKIDVQAAVTEAIKCSGVDYVNVGGVKVYPLPAASDVNIVLDSSVLKSENLSLFDESGRAVTVPFELNGGVLHLDVSGLSSGIYSGALGGTKFKFIVK